jgi:hypothetical protein
VFWSSSSLHRVRSRVLPQSDPLARQLVVALRPLQGKALCRSRELKALGYLSIVSRTLKRFRSSASSSQSTPSKSRVVDLDKEDDLPESGNNRVGEDDNVSGKVHLELLKKTSLLVAAFRTGQD